MEVGTQRLASTNAVPGNDLARALEAATGEAIGKSASLYELLKRPAIDAQAIGAALAGSGAEALDLEVLAQLEVEAKYAGLHAAPGR